MAFVSAALLGFYDVSKKHSLRGNAVIPILCLNTLFCALLFLPGIISGHIAQLSAEHHGLVLIKACIVLGSWILGYYAMAQLPLTIVGPVNATRPVLTVVGALLIFGEDLNAWQWAGVAIALVSFWLLSRSGRKEGISFKANRYVWFLVAAAMLGAASGLYDKYLINTRGVDRLAVQGWYNVYQCAMMAVVLAVVWWPRRREGAPFQWRWSIVLISLFLTAADMTYFYALTDSEVKIAVVSMVRRSSVIVSFACGALFFAEKNLRSKALDLLLVLLSMACLYIGTR